MNNTKEWTVSIASHPGLTKLQKELIFSCNVRPLSLSDHRTDKPRSQRRQEARDAIKQQKQAKPWSRRQKAN